jgi:hypothetical protein
MAQPRLRHALVQDGEVGRVERRIAHARERRRQHQPRVALRRGRRQRRQHKEPEGREQHRAGPGLVHHKAGERLADAADDEEHRHQQPEFGVAQAELADEHREQGRQQQVEEVRGGVRKADQADDGEVGARRHRRRGNR